MTNLHFFFPEQLGVALGWMVLHVLWQATLIGVVAGLVLVAMRRGPARRRYWMANIARATILLAALGTFIYYFFGSMPNPCTSPLPAMASSFSDFGSKVSPVPSPHNASIRNGSLSRRRCARTPAHNLAT